jgi:hypothetical protein
MTGTHGAIFEQRVGDCLGLYRESYVSYRKLAEAVQKTGAFRDAISVKFVEEELFEWLTGDHPASEAESFCQRLTRRATEVIERFDAWIPVNSLFVQSAFPLGAVTFRTMPGSLLEAWKSQLLAGAGSDDERAVSLSRLRKVDRESEPNSDRFARLVVRWSK